MSSCAATASLTRTVRLALAGLLMLASLAASAADEVMLYRREENVGKPLHSELVLKEALRRTARKYGVARFQYAGGSLARERLLIEMIKGDIINVAVVATQPSWESSTLPVWVPVDMGLTSYRIGFVRKDEQARLSAVHDLHDLQKITIGVGLGWSSRKILEASNLNLQPAKDQEALTKMLLARRLDYFPRGVNEVFAEYDAMEERSPDLAIERDLVLEFPLPTYIFVSPSAPHLARRISEGLESMVRDGTLLKMVTQYHAEMLQRANLCARRLIRLPNPLLTPENPIGRKELWFDPFSKKTGLCTQKASR